MLHPMEMESVAILYIAIHIFASDDIETFTTIIYLFSCNKIIKILCKFNGKWVEILLVHQCQL